MSSKLSKSYKKKNVSLDSLINSIRTMDLKAMDNKTKIRVKKYLKSKSKARRTKNLKKIFERIAKMEDDEKKLNKEYDKCYKIFIDRRYYNKYPDIVNHIHDKEYFISQIEEYVGRDTLQHELEKAFDYLDEEDLAKIGNLKL